MAKNEREVGRIPSLTGDEILPALNVSLHPLSLP
jgi:hypothetical protein